MGTEPYMALRTSVTSKTNSYTVKFDRTIDSPHMWQEEIDTIRQAKSGDDVTVYVNTTGGSAYTLKEVIHAIESSEATFHGVLAGSAYSAGGPIFLACDTFEVGQLADMMCHTVQSGYEGSGNALHKFGEHLNTEARILIEKCYEGFLTQAEMEDILIGDDIWLQADEIVDRLNKRQQYFLDKEPKLSLEDHVEFLQQDLLEYAKESNVDHEDLVKGLLEVLYPVKDRTNKETKIITPDDLPEEEFKEGAYHLTVLANGRLDDHSDEPMFTSFVKVCTEGEMDLLDLKAYAKLLDVSFAHNISLKVLAERVDRKIKEIVDSLNVK